MVETIELGSLFLNGNPVPLGARYSGEQISFGNAAPGMGIPFVRWNDLYIAGRCICVNISWENLHKEGFIFGRPVKVDGKAYLCRSLKVGAERGVPNEWDSLLNDLGEDNAIWHWDCKFFWGQETSSKWPSSRAVRGYLSARHWGNYTASIRGVNVGFRPVLEPLPPEPLVSNALIGQGIKVYSNNCSVTGRLVSYDDYDLELATSSPLSKTHPWIRQMKDTIFVDRDAITYLCEEK